MNALENVTIPKIEAILDYIARELDELEREGGYRRQRRGESWCTLSICLSITSKVLTLTF